MDISEFLRRLYLEDDKADKRFAFFLGAGCSVTSGIPAAGALVADHWVPRLRDIHDPDQPDHEAWATRNIPGYDPKNPAASYGDLIDRLFVTADDRQREMELLCDGRSPGFGYAVLAQLVAKPNARFNIVLTSNFDDLMADALYLYTDSRPLVIHHESLAAFIRPTRTRPLVIKLHGDHRLAPRNTHLETEALEAEVGRHTAMVLNDRGLIVIGYGGNDKGIQNLLNDLPREALQFGVYWIASHEPAGPTRDWLIQRGGVWVRGRGFDEIMLLARDRFSLPHPDPARFTRIFEDYQAAFQRLSNEIESKPETDTEASALKQALQSTERSFPDYWKAITEAMRIEKSDPSSAETLFKSAIAQFPEKTPPLTAYANFLSEKPDRVEEAAKLYERAIEVNGKYAPALGNYAVLLHRMMPGRRGEAEAFYKSAIDAAPEKVIHLSNYAVYLHESPGRAAEAETLYRRALEIDPTYFKVLSNYANWLSQTPGRQKEAEGFYKRALEADPTDAGLLERYAEYLEQVRKDTTGAADLRRRRLAITHATI